MDVRAVENIPIACDLAALAPEVRATHLEAARQLLGADAAEIRELPDGLALRYTADQFERVAQFIASERLCCPFFSFTLEVAPAQGPIWLRITGDEGVKEFVRAELVQ